MKKTPYEIIRDNIASGAYDNKVPYPDDKDYKEGRKDVGYRIARDKYNEGSIAATHKFHKDLKTEYGTYYYPKEEKIWEKAWEDGHSNGHLEILNEYDELVGLIII